MIIYKLTFANGKSYIGQTMRDLRTRVREHRKASNGLPVARAFRRYGEPEAEILYTAQSVDEMNELEISAIVGHRTMKPDGYNICEGGRPAPMRNPEVAARVGLLNRGRVFSEETRSRMSAAAKARVRKPHSAETRAKMAESAKRAHATANDDKRSIAIRAAHAARSPEDRSEAARKAWATKRANGGN